MCQDISHSADRESQIPYNSYLYKPFFQVHWLGYEATHLVSKKKSGEKVTVTDRGQSVSSKSSVLIGTDSAGHRKYYKREGTVSLDTVAACGGCGSG